VFWNPLEPDSLGESLVADTFGAEPDVLAGVLESPDATTVVRPLDVLARTAVDHPTLRNTASAVLGERLSVLCDLAVAQVAGTPDLAVLLGDSLLAAALGRAASAIAVDPTVLPGVLTCCPAGAASCSAPSLER
jgi:hypothetical protein